MSERNRRASRDRLEVDVDGGILLQRPKLQRGLISKEMLIGEEQTSCQGTLDPAS
jgi:hypothetical protein